MPAAFTACLVIFAVFPFICAVPIGCIEPVGCAEAAVSALSIVPVVLAESGECGRQIFLYGIVACGTGGHSRKDANGFAVPMFRFCKVFCRYRKTVCERLAVQLDE